MFYQHKKTGQKLEIKIDCGDIVSVYVLDDDLNRLKNSSGHIVKLCNKKNLKGL